MRFGVVGKRQATAFSRVGRHVFCLVYRGAYFEQPASLAGMDLRDLFATNLRRVRHQQGLSQDDLAYEADISRSYLSQIEKGTFHVSLKVIGKLAEALDVEPAEFLKASSAQE